VFLFIFFLLLFVGMLPLEDIIYLVWNVESGCCMQMTTMFGKVGSAWGGKSSATNKYEVQGGENRWWRKIVIISEFV